MNKKERFVTGFVFGFIMIVVIAVYGMITYHIGLNRGKDNGREETIKILNEIANEYEFIIHDNDGWQLGTGTNGDFYANSSDSLRVDYDWDDCKIRLQYVPK